ncbi:uncharacterized protein K02A2.6-like [Helianthus annuus]|uniref:uncharacterized protein K02A2.6-like n=1 Tax=Helianthus annuus TaxID=4232 RepID=UPI000B8F30CD|nr:uncharacterized protein K02A2.6-like [Helianthus annuus]
MVGPFPEAPGAVKFIIVAVDYFTKWVEAKALASTTSAVVKRFIWEQIICRFGLPLRIITDNGTNFAADDLERWFKELNIEHTFSSVAHPQGNGQVEAVNKSIVDGIKARLGEKRRGWVDELPSILWAHRTMPKTSNGDYVLRDNEASNAEKPGKLAPKWEGPYIIDEVLGKGAYKLRTINDKEVPRTWNAQQLRKCYM